MTGTSYEVIRPGIFAVEPSKIAVDSTASLVLRGRFGGSSVGVVLNDGTYELRIPSLAVKPQGDGTDTVEFTLPPNVEAKRYRVSASRGGCASSRKDIFLDVERAPANASWFIASLNNVLVRDDLDNTAPGEARFVLGGQSKTAVGERRTEVTFPAGQYITIRQNETPFVSDLSYLSDDEKETVKDSHIYPNVPFIWEPYGDLGEEIGFTIGSTEDDPSTALPEWVTPLLSLLGGAIGCYVEKSFEGCKTGYDIATKLGNGLKDFFKTDPKNTVFGAAADVCKKETFYCLGSETNDKTTLTRNVPHDVADHKLELEIELRKVDAPRLEAIWIDLRKVALQFGHPDNGNDDWKSKSPIREGEEIYLIYRITPLSYVSRRLNAHRYEPATAPGAEVIFLCSPKERAAGCKKASEITWAPGVKRLYPRGDEALATLADKRGIPGVHVEISVWEDDGGDEQHMLAMSSQTYLLGDVLATRREWRSGVNTTLHSYVDLVEHSSIKAGAPNAVNPTAVELGYDLYVRRALRP